MAPLNIPALRLASQRISAPLAAGPAEVVRHLGAVQAQDYASALWATGLRVGPGAVEAGIEDAVTARTIVRTWPMRGTLHFVAADDVRWMLELLTPRVIRRSAGRYRDLELDQGTFSRSRKVLVKALRDGQVVTRQTLYQLLNAAGIATDGSRGLHILGHLAQEGLICFGPRAGRQPTFVLLPEWLPDARPRPREESLAEIAGRYFGSHGPATVADFSWWSGLTMVEARAAIELAGDDLREDRVGGIGYLRAAAGSDVTPGRGESMYLLPAWDEYTVAYRDRSAILDPRHARAVNNGGGMLLPVVVSAGRVIGTWRRTRSRSSAAIAVSPFAPLGSGKLQAVHRAAERYRDFLSLERVECRVAAGGD